MNKPANGKELEQLLIQKPHQAYMFLRGAGLMDELEGDADDMTLALKDIAYGLWDMAKGMARFLFHLFMVPLYPLYKGWKIYHIREIVKKHPGIFAGVSFIEEAEAADGRAEGEK